MEVDFLDWLQVPDGDPAELKEIEKKQKPEEEIKKYTVDEDIDDESRVSYLLRRGDKRQVIPAIGTLPRLVREYGDTFFITVLRVLEEVLPKSDDSCQIIAGEVFVQLLPLLSDSSLHQTFPLIFSMLRSTKVEVASEWMAVITNTIPRASPSLLSETTQFALLRAEVSETTSSRVMSCRICGSLSRILPPEEIEKSFLNVCLRMCQDTDGDVRRTMSEEMEVIARVMKNKTCVLLDRIVPEIEELLGDEEDDVRSDAVGTYVGLLDVFPLEFRVSHMRPRILRFLRDPSDVLLSSLLTNFVTIVTSLGSYLSDDMEQLVVFDFFKRCVTSPDCSIRSRAASSFSGVLRGVGARRYALHFHDSLMSLVQDKEVMCRVSIGKEFSELSLVVGKERTVQYLKVPFFMLLRDESEEVRVGVCTHFNVVVKQFAISNIDQRTSLYTELLNCLVVFEGTLGLNWRAKCSFLDNMRDCYSLFSPELMTEKFLPIVLRLMSSSHIPVKKCAADAFAYCLRYCRDPTTKFELLEKCRLEFCRSKSYWNRIQYLQICDSILRFFSRKYFRDNFFDNALLLSKDSVFSVRLKFVSLLPLLKAVMKPPSDVSVIAKLNERVSHLSMDKDVVVVERTKEVQKLLHEVEKVSLGRMRDVKREEDVVDEKREEEERELSVQDAEFMRRRKRFMRRGEEKRSRVQGRERDGTSLMSRFVSSTSRTPSGKKGTKSPFRRQMK